MQAGMHSSRPGAYFFQSLWTGVDSRILKKYSWMLHTLPHSWSQRASGDRSLGGKKKEKKATKYAKSSQFISPSTESLNSTMLVLKHAHTQGIIFFLRSAESQTTLPHWHMPIPIFCFYPSPPASHMFQSFRELSPTHAAAVTTSDELFAWLSREEMALCTAVVLDEYILKFHFL